MKKTCIILLSVFIFACNNAEKKDGTDSSTKGSADTASTTTSTLPAGITQEDYDKGLNLVASSDCTTCHQVSTKVTGPAYADVANKYEATKDNIKMLAEKVIKGGQGVWGPTAMTPHPDISQEDAETMVKYVLSLKTAK